MTNNISEGSSSFLIKDEDLLLGWESNIIKYLKSEGFVSWGKKGYYDGINWIYININNKLFAFGMPGIPITTPVGNHAITFEEFLNIYEIYKKYDINHPLKMVKKNKEVNI